MAKVTLLIDQGNTRLKWVSAQRGDLHEDRAGRGNFKAFVNACRSGEMESPESIRFSSVAGDQAAQELTEFCEAHWRITPLQLKSTGQAGGVRNAYPEAGSLGVDRWLAIIGAVARYGKPVVIWDLGTATTLDAVDETGQHVGGMIYPGPSTMLNALRRETKLRVPESLAGAGALPGRSTAACIGNGVFAAQLGALNQFMRHAPESAGGKARLIVTGGAAAEILPLLEFEHVHDPWLVFRGMLIEGLR